MKEIIIGSRGSDLALWQANFVQSSLSKLGYPSKIKIIKTQGDLIQHLSFDKLEGKGFFTKEIEDSLLNGEIDLAVHSHKDLETNSPEELLIAAVPQRANPEDVLIIKKNSVDLESKWRLKPNSIVGTSSARRKSQLIALRSDVKTKDLRGNVPTRIQKLRDGNYDAILLAKAGTDRLKIDLSEFEVVVLDPSEFVPAPAQGALGLQIRTSHSELASILEKMNDSDVKRRIDMERKVLNLLEGGCQMPLGAYCNNNDELFISFANNLDSERIFIKYQVSDFDAMPEIVIADLKDRLVQ